MPEKVVTVRVPTALYDEAVSRLRAAGRDDAEALLKDALQASAVDAAEIAGGDGALPTALNDVRAARLYVLCEARKEILGDELVAIGACQVV